MQHQDSKPDSLMSLHLAAKATKLREQAVRMLGSPERDKLLRTADACDQAAGMYAYVNSQELKPPT